MRAEIGPQSLLTEDGVPVRVRVAGREIAVVQWRGEVFAFRTVCPHQGAPLWAGQVRTKIVRRGKRVGEIDWTDTPVIVCPWHQWEYDLRTGRSAWDPRYGIRCYSVDLVNGRLFVDMPGRTRTDDGDKPSEVG